MLTKFLQSIAGYKQEEYNFASDLNKFLNNIQSDDVIIGTHGHCTDGTVAGSVLRYSFPYAKIVPIEYWYLNHEEVYPILSDLKWYGMVDIKPFNNHPMEFWVDHHISSMEATLRARKIRYDVQGDSGAYQLYLSRFTKILPEYLLELILMTRITDTAGYTTPPPVQQIDSLEDLQFQPTSTKDDRKKYEQKVWLLDDATSILNTFKDHQKAYTGFAKDGYYHLHTYLPAVNSMRRERKVAFDTADSLELADCVVVATLQDQIDIFSLRRKLLLRDVKIVITLVKYPGGVKISMRRKKYLSDALNSQIQLHTLAAQLNGGGHAGASGAHAPTIDAALEKITEWMNARGFTMIFHEI